VQGLILDVREVPHRFAHHIGAESPERATIFREIADVYYPIEGDEDEDDDLRGDCLSITTR
jgi:hypothetical protein